MALIHTTISPGGYAELDGIQIDESDEAFDRAELSILFRGTEAQLRAAFLKGGSSYPGSGVQMICAGVRITRSRFGFLWAVVMYTGFITAPSSAISGGVSLLMAGASIAVKAFVDNASTSELLLPFSLPGGGSIDAGAPYNSANVALARSRTRVVQPVWSRQFTGVLIVARSAPPQRPKLMGGLRPAGLPTVFNNATAAQTSVLAISQSNWFDGINTADSNGGGWCLRNFQAASATVLGAWLLVKWTADFEWIDRFTAA